MRQCGLDIQCCPASKHTSIGACNVCYLVSSSVGPSDVSACHHGVWNFHPVLSTEMSMHACLEVLRTPCTRVTLEERRGAGRDALEGKGPHRRPQKRLDRRLEEVAEAVGDGYCRLQMPSKLAVAVRGTVAVRRLGALEGGGGTSPLSNASLGAGGGGLAPKSLCRNFSLLQISFFPTGFRGGGGPPMAVGHSKVRLPFTHRRPYTLRLHGNSTHVNT